MAEEKIVVQITLDNGSVLKGFAEIQQKANKLEGNLEKSLSGKAIENLGDVAKKQFGFIGSLIDKMPTGLGVFGASLFAVKKRFLKRG
jgi:hypothetical protein